MQDEKIVGLFWERNEDAVSALKDRYGAYCLSIAKNILDSNEDVEEVLNDVYMSVWNAVPPEKPHNLSAFVGRITRNLSLKKWRSNTADKRGGGQTTVVLGELAECLPATNDVEEEITAKELSRVIEDFLYNTPETERNIFVCRYWYHDSISDICEQFGFTQSKVKMSLLRSRQKLLKFLETKGVTL